jgi:hypothetical protein
MLQTQNTGASVDHNTIRSPACPYACSILYWTFTDNYGPPNNNFFDWNGYQASVQFMGDAQPTQHNNTVGPNNHVVQ